MLTTEQVKLYAERYTATLEPDGTPTKATRDFWNDEPLVNDKERADIAKEVAWLLKERAQIDSISQDAERQSSEGAASVDSINEATSEVQETTSIPADCEVTIA